MFRPRRGQSLRRSRLIFSAFGGSPTPWRHLITSANYSVSPSGLMRSVAFWAGKTTRSHQSYDHTLDDKTVSRQFGNALEPEELSPGNMVQARLLVRGTAGHMVELIDWTDFVKYLDELRGALNRRVRSQIPCPVSK